MRMSKTLNMLAMVGETLVVLGAAMWIFVPTVAAVVLAVGTVLFIVSRMAGSDGDGKKMGDPSLTITVRHLYRQRILSYVLLTLAAVFLFLPAGFYFGIYMRESMWLVPFIAFAIIEIYTAFRLPAASKQ